MISKQQKRGTQNHSDLEQIESLKKGYSKITKQIETVIVGQRQIIDELLIALFPKDIALSSVSPDWRKRCSSRHSPECST